MNFALALAIAINFWSVRGAEVPCQPVAVPGARLALDGQFAWFNERHPGEAIQIPMAADGCRILISKDGAATRREDPNDYCMYVTHEVGHIAGLGHSETGLMAESGQTASDNPWYCDHWRVFARRHGFTAGSRRGSESARRP